MTFTVLPEMPQTSSRPRRAWLPAVVAAAVLAAVGGGYVALNGGSSSGTSYVNAAAIVHGTSARATQAGTSSLDLTMDMSIQGHDVTATGDGAFDYRKHRGRMDINLAGFGTMQEVITRHAIYMRMPDAMAGALTAATGGKPWLELRFSALKTAGIDMSKLMNSNPTADPASLLRVLSGSTGVTQSGTETIDGVPTTKYSATSSVADLLRAEGMTDVVDPSKLPAGMGNSQMHFDVWVDHTGLARRLSMTMDLAGMGTMSMTMHFYGFGDPVTVIVPPQSIVADISSLAGL